MEGSPPWIDLPQELLLLISDTLSGRQISKLRLHSVCSAWRSTVSLEPRFPPRLVHRSSGRYFSKRTVFSLSPPPGHRSSGSHDLESTAFWIIKIEDRAFPGKKRICNPLMDEYVLGPVPVGFPRTIDLLKFDVVELGHEYIFWTHDAWYDLTVERVHRDKLAVCFLGKDGRDFVVLALDFPGSPLTMYRAAENGEMQQGVAFDETRSFADLITYRGMFYAVDVHGITHVIRPESMEVIQTLVNKVELCGNKKRLVECEGNLLLIDICSKKVCCGSERVRVKLLRLDRERERWVESGSVGDRVVFLGEKISFAAPVSGRCKGNRIVFEYVDSDDIGVYAEDDFLGLSYFKVYDLENGRVSDLTATSQLVNLICPPPSWITTPFHPDT